MNIITERLELIPLTAIQLEKWVYDIQALENELCCTYDAEPMTGIFLEIVKGQLTATKNDAENYKWHSFWLIIRKTDRTVIGSSDFKDVPNADGEVEIGYGLGKKYEHKGYMTEAVTAMCEWALKQFGVSFIIAETDTDGLASQRILRRCGFHEYKKGDTVWWRR